MSTADFCQARYDGKLDCASKSKQMLLAFSEKLR